MSTPPGRVATFSSGNTGSAIPTGYSATVQRVRVSPVADFLVPEGFAGPRGILALAREGSVVLEAARYRRRVSADRATRRSRPYASRSEARGLGDPVLLVPGF